MKTLRIRITETSVYQLSITEERRQRYKDISKKNHMSIVGMVRIALKEEGVGDLANRNEISQMLIHKGYKYLSKFLSDRVFT